MKSEDAYSGEQSYPRLDGGAADEEGILFSGSLDLLRRPGAAAPRFAADILGRSGELDRVRQNMQHKAQQGCR